MSTPQEPNFDWSQAASLLGDNPDDVSEDMGAIVIELIEGAKHEFDELKKMKAETDRKAISAKAHQLRGSLLNFGFAEVGTILNDVERGEWPPENYPGMIEKAENAFVASRKMFAARYPKLGLS